jgi:hypothetical protein
MSGRPCSSSVKGNRFPNPARRSFPSSPTCVPSPASPPAYAPQNLSVSPASPGNSDLFPSAHALFLVSGALHAFRPVFQSFGGSVFRIWEVKASVRSGCSFRPIDSPKHRPRSGTDSPKHRPPDTPPFAWFAVKNRRLRIVDYRS